MQEKNINHLRQPPDIGNSFMHFQVLEIPKKSLASALTKNNITVLDLLRYSSEKQKILVAVAALCSLGAGILMPTYSSETANATQVIQSSLEGNIVVSFLNDVGFKFLWFGLLMLISMVISNILWFWVAERQAAAIRNAYFKALLAQQIGFYDNHSPTSILATFSSDLDAIQVAIANKAGVLFQIIGCVGATLIYIFTTAWLLSLVSLGMLPIILITGYFYLKSYEGRNQEYKKIYRKAGELSEQAFYAIKTVKQMNAEERQAKKYSQELQNISGQHVRISAKIGASIGLMNFCFFGLCALIYWFGSQCMIDDSSICPKSVSRQDYTARMVCEVYYLVMNCYYMIVVLSPTVAALKAGLQSAQKVFGVIDREPVIKKQETGLVLENLQGNIRFQNVSFSYPQNKSKTIIKNLNLQLKVGNNVVLGESGCGKSTLIHLILRIYDPDEGVIFIDGYDLRTLNLAWFRSQLGFVQQQPLLFAGSVEDNLKLYCPHTTKQEIDEALKKAQVYDFIYKQQPLGLKTEVGMRGQQLSGGQKQRIALARALLRKPKIMLFDEFTSALDQQNERRILRNLASLPYKMNIVSVTHKVEVMKASDYAVILDQGSILQEGKFTQLAFFNQLSLLPQLTNIKKMLSTGSVNQTLKKKDSNKPSEKEVNDYLNNSQEMIKMDELQAFQMYLQDQPKLKNDKPEFQQQRSIIQALNDPINNKQSEIGILDLMCRLFSFNRDKKYLFGLALFFSFLLGFVIPSTSYIFARIYTSLFKISATQTFQDGIDLRKSSLLIYIFLSIGYFLLTFLQILTSFVMGSETTKNIRISVYDKLLKLPISWFERRENNPGVLAEKLGQGCQVISQLISVLIFVFTIMITGIVSCYLIGFLFNWQITLVGIGFFPFIMLSAYLKSYYNNRINKVLQSVRHDSNIILNESLIAIKTVTSLNIERELYQRYNIVEQRAEDEIFALGIKMGIVGAIGSFLNFAVLGTLFYFTGRLLLITNYSVGFQGVLVALFQCANITYLISSNYHFLPNIGQAKQIAATVLKYLQEQDQDMMQIRQNSLLLREGIQEGRIQFRNVSFSYQAREEKIFSNFSFLLKPKSNVSIIGRSGCGKSTIINLIQRFYNPSLGQIFIDGINIKDFDVHYLRSKLGVVSQQPLLLNDTIMESVRYSSPQANEQQVIAACQKVNALKFIDDYQQNNLQSVFQIKKCNPNPEEPIRITEAKIRDGKGFDKMVGFNGSRLSGGQKQRIAIARMLIKQPTIFLFDEVTSALDIQNEQLIQRLLSIISHGKSTLNISHKLQTLKDSDEIILMDKGVIVERGTYKDLRTREGYFLTLHKGKSGKNMP